MKNRKNCPHNDITNNSDGEMSSRYHRKIYKMYANSDNSWWRRVISIGVLLQILVNCGKFNYSFLLFSFTFLLLRCPLIVIRLKEILRCTQNGKWNLCQPYTMLPCTFRWRIRLKNEKHSLMLEILLSL